jgi:hypothetical protein
MADEIQKKRFEVAVQVRNFEIELFWKRSVFFWGFISSAFVGYAALRKLNPDLALVVACFGMVCSCAWTLLNRGSKYWQENWETKVESAELVITGTFFAEEEKLQAHKGWWLSARKFSVSKLAIALSDYVFFLWFCLVVGESFRRFAPGCAGALKSYGLGLFLAFSFLYLVLLFVYGRKSPRPSANPS